MRSLLILAFGVLLSVSQMQPAHAIGAKPNKNEVFECLSAQSTARGRINVAPCLNLTLIPCERWFKRDTVDLYSSCLRGLGWNWSALLNAGLDTLDERIGLDQERDVSARVSVWRDALRRHCRSLPKLETRSVHLRDANRRACTLGVNAVLTFIVETRPEDLITAPAIEA